MQAPGAAVEGASPAERAGGCLQPQPRGSLVPHAQWFGNFPLHNSPFLCPPPVSYVLHGINLINYSLFHVAEQFQRCHILLSADPVTLQVQI